MIEHHGWQVAASFGSPPDEAARTRESVGLADVSWLSKFHLQGPGLSSAPDFQPEASTWQLGRRQYLMICEPSAAAGVWKRLEPFSGSDATPAATIYATDVTSAYTQLLVAGPQCREVLGKLTSLNLSESANFTCGQASVAHVPAVVLRNDFPDTPAFHLLVGREYGESVWEAVLHAGHEFHIALVGLDAIRLLLG